MTLHAPANAREDFWGPQPLTSRASQRRGDSGATEIAAFRRDKWIRCISVQRSSHEAPTIGEVGAVMRAHWVEQFWKEPWSQRLFH